MKRLATIFAALLLAVSAMSQEVGNPVGELPAPKMPMPTDTLHLPLLNQYGQVPIGMFPFNWGGYMDWSLHEGLNVNLGASVFGSWGRSKYLGTGFSQDVSMMYAVPLAKKLSLAIGGYFSNTYFMHDTYRDAGVNAVLGYKFNDHWEAYLYGQKSLVQTRMPMPLYGMSNIGDRIGAAVKYNFSPSFSVELRVESHNFNQPAPGARGMATRFHSEMP